MITELSTRMILVEDLVDKVTGRLLDKIVNNQSLIYAKSPLTCNECNSQEIVGVEIMGADNGILLWECETCNEMFLKYEPEKTEIQLQKAKDYWTNPKDWGYLPKSKFS
tara:strand:+ start:3202 stop:3528 length:327 start_codon:yes stop_codon:yes gene_type:complete